MLKQHHPIDNCSSLTNNIFIQRHCGTKLCMYSPKQTQDINLHFHPYLQVLSWKKNSFFAFPHKKRSFFFHDWWEYASSAPFPAVPVCRDPEFPGESPGEGPGSIIHSNVLLLPSDLRSPDDYPLFPTHILFVHGSFDFVLLLLLGLLLWWCFSVPVSKFSRDKHSLGEIFIFWCSSVLCLRSISGKK